jgi:D-beta-D-heptose 7-phosphate kinase/D-beta-D-heptose 1-phosphate adenosyltransferase
MKARCRAAKERGIPVLVIPRSRISTTTPVSPSITPNHSEAEIATNMRVRTEGRCRVAARVFQERAACGAVLMTRGDQGMWLLRRGVEGHLPAAAGKWPMSPARATP